MQRIAPISIAILTFSILYGCGSSDSPRATTISVSPESVTLTYLGETATVTANVLDQNGRPFSGTVAWSSSDEAVFTVSAGEVTAVANGSGTLTASIENLRAEASVTVRQALDALEVVSGAGQQGIVGKPLPASIAVRAVDAGGAPIADVSVRFAVAGEKGSVDPAGVETGPDGTAKTAWTLGPTTGAQELTASAGDENVTIMAEAGCEGPLALDVGEWREFPPTPESGCGFAIKAAEVGEYYRVTFVRPSKEFQLGATIALDISVPENGASSSFAGIAARLLAQDGRAAPARSTQSAPSMSDPRMAQRIRERESLLEPLASGALRPLPDLRYTADPLERPPDTLDFTQGAPGTIEDNCRVSETRTGHLVTFNDHVAFYVEEDAEEDAEEYTPPLNREHVEIVADFYDDYGAEVIDTYFDGVSDVDGNRRINVFIDSKMPSTITGIVWIGDMLSKADCAASNESELIRLNHSWFEIVYSSLTGALVHEAQHISSGYRWMQRSADDPPLDVFGKLDAAALWIDEGQAEIANEMAARLAWEAQRGPRPQDRVSKDHLLTSPMESADLHGILWVLSGVKLAFSDEPYALDWSPYGAGWHLFRFLGDHYGNPDGLRLGDAELFRKLNDVETSADIGGIEKVTGRTWEQVMLDYAIATSLSGTGAPVAGDAPRFKTYDFTGLSIEGYFFDHPGRYPWPATMSGEDEEAPLWVALGVPRMLKGTLERNGLRIHDFRAERVGETATFRIEGPSNARVVVVRLPDQQQIDPIG